MAASQAHFSREQVLEEVCAEEEVCEENEDPPLTLEDVLKLSVDNFRRLRPSIGNFSDFCEEARGELAAVYHRHENGVHGMDKVLLSSEPVWPMISGEVVQWLNVLRRRMLASPKARNPWTIEIKRDLPKEIFVSLKKAIQGAVSSFGVSVEDTVITYYHKNRLLRDFSKFYNISRSEVDNKLKKTFGGKRKGFKAEVLVSREKPAVIAYNGKRKQIAFSCHYGCWNEFGYGFHG